MSTAGASSNIESNNQNGGPFNNRLPLIPLSPLTQTSIEYAKALAQTTKSLSETTIPETIGSSNSNIISLLNKDLSKERENLDRLTKDIQNIQSKLLSDLDSYEIAKEIAYINCSLFRLVQLNKTWISNFDKQSNIVPLLDFHRYLSHSFAHQVIYSAEENNLNTGSKKRRSANNTNNTIAQLIKVAYILLHIYRDFSGCSAVLTSLQMPEVQRLERIWSQCPAKLVSTYKNLVSILSPNNNYEVYHHHVWLHTARFLNTTQLKSQMIAVPFMHAHLTMIRNIVHTHSAVMNNGKQNIVLSDAGKKAFISAIHVLEFCQQHTKIDPTELDRPMTLAASRRLSTSSKRKSSVYASGFKLSASPCLELDKLHTSPNMYHWIVSRAYLTRAQLHQESLQVEPLAVGEIELEAEEEYDLYWDFFSQSTLSEDTNKKTKSPTLSLSKSTIKVPKAKPQQEEQQQQQQQQQKQDDGNSSSLDLADHQDIVDNLVIVSPDTSKQGDNDDNVAQTPDVLTSTSDVADDLTKENNNEIIIKDLLTQDIKKKDVINKIEKEAKEEEQDLEIESTPTASQDVQQSTNATDTTNDTNIEIIKTNDLAELPVPTIKPILSPAAPEFVPQNQYDNSEDDDVIIVTEEMSYTADDDGEEEEEEWTGYPADNTSVSQLEETVANKNEEDEEDEEWTGYPTASQDEDEDDDEVWKGYPTPNNQQHSPKTIELSSPSTPKEEQQHQHQHQQHNNTTSTSQHFISHEEWKGYDRTNREKHQNNNTTRSALIVNKDYPTSWDNNKNQLHAIGKAAARKMQYSISTTDNRKKLPTLFTPSAST